MAKGPKKTAAVRSLAKALSHSLHPTYLLGPDGQLLFANPALAKVLGVTEEFLTNKLLGASCHSPLSEVTATGRGFRRRRFRSWPPPSPAQPSRPDKGQLLAGSNSLD